MTLYRSAALWSGLGVLALLAGCVGGLLGGGKPDSLYRFDAFEPPAVAGPAAMAQQTLLLDKVRFVPEIDGDRILAVHEGSARYIKGSRWVTDAPSLFTQGMLRSLQARAPGLRVTTMPRGAVAGYALAITITRFAAQYDDASMMRPPVIVVEGDVTLYGLADRKVVTQRHVVARAGAGRNRAGDIVSAFDQATTLFAADVSDGVQSAALDQGRAPAPQSAGR